MNDFDLTDWCDFVRGAAEPAAEREMRQVLASGSASARKSVHLLRRVAEVAEADLATPVPEYAVQVAKAIGSLRRPDEELVRTKSSLLRWLPVTVTFDSWLQPASAGTRDLQSSHRQIVFDAESYTVDVRLESESAVRRNASGDLVGASSVVVGQVLERRPELPQEAGDRQEPILPAVDVPVLVLSEGRVVEHCRTSRFGEFQAAGLPQRDLSLCFLVGQDKCIDIPLGMTQDW